MSLFSFRKGIKKNPDTYQIETISPALKNRLWSCLYTEFFQNMYHRYTSGEIERPINRSFCEDIWHNFFKLPIDSLNSSGSQTRKEIRSFFFNKAQWYEIYDFIEFCIQHSRRSNLYFFFENVNTVLKEEFAGYRLIGGNIAQITDEIEIKSIEDAMSFDDEISGHISTALDLLSNKTESESKYRNSIKESISAVEAICKKIAGNPKINCGQALNEIEKCGKIRFNGAEKAAFSNLYGWTSGPGGIRHAMMESEDLDQEDARFMLIACSAFINFLRVKADKANIEIN